jgi:hypothetical protein
MSKYRQETLFIFRMGSGFVLQVVGVIDYTASVIGQGILSLHGIGHALQALLLAFLTDIHGSVRIRVIHAIRVRSQKK